MHRVPRLQIVVTAGNHDSPARLAAPQPILDNFRIHVVGSLRDARGEIDLDRVLVDLYDESGLARAVCVALPFLRPSDLPFADLGGNVEADSDPIVAAAQQVHEEVFAAARARIRPGMALVGMGHAYMEGGSLSESSERKVLGGNQHPLPVSLFPPDVAYVALGHLHLAQAVGGHEHIRYSGSPIPLSMTESGYRHQVTLVELQGAELHSVDHLRIPRTVDMVRVPKEADLPLDEALERLRALPSIEDFEPACRPFLEVAIGLTEPVPDLRRQVEAALDGRGPRLARLRTEHHGSGLGLAATRPQFRLQELAPEQVFRSLYSRHHDGDPSDELLAAFHELVDHVGQTDSEVG